MRKSIDIICAAALFLMGVCSCQNSKQTPVDPVDLRYRVNDEYSLPSHDAQPFTIVVTSSKPWSIFSDNPDWCIIDEEEGEASDPELVLIGRGNKTTVHVQYYDNNDLDDRTDRITIKSDYWIGKVVTIKQKGIAYLDIPEDEKDIEVIKAGGDVEFHISSNQDWSTKVTSGDWISIVEGETGTGDGTVKLLSQDNPGEKRYASLEVYDRHGLKVHDVNFTQDGVQLDPAAFEIRAGYDQKSTSLDIVANSKWTAVRDNENDTWYTITNPEGDGDGTLEITLDENTGTGLRVGHIILKSVAVNPEDFVAEKIITVKQAYRIEPVRIYFDNDEMGKWKSDKANTPVWTKGVGTLFVSEARLNNGDMPFGTYTFRWSSITPEARVRHWFCYGDGQEIKFNIVSASNKLAMEFNSSSSGVSGKPDMISSYEIDPSAQPIELTLKFDPSGDKYCHITYLYNGTEICSFDSSDSVMHKVTWGGDINMYVGVDSGGSAVCEYYEYTEPVNWDE